MNAGGKQSLVGVDVSNAGEEGLAQQDSFDFASPLPQSANEFFNWNCQSIRANRRQYRLLLGKKLKTAKSTDIVEEQVSFVQFKGRARILAGFPIP